MTLEGLMNTPRTLTRNQLRELEAELRSERARLERSMNDRSSDAGWSDADAGNGFSEAGGAIGLQTQVDARYDAIIAAIARLADGTYGICTVCQNPIPFGRLIVMPEVTSCLGCRSRN
jgi:RNA polymerase-binding transcription factor DksA